MDEIKINELYLYTVNTGDLYRKVAQPIMDNLAKKIANGTYDKTKALIAWQRLADQGAARYDREINDGRGSMMWIPKKEREEVAKLIQEHYEEELNEKVEKLKSEKKKSSLNESELINQIKKEIKNSLNGDIKEFESKNPNTIKMRMIEQPNRGSLDDAFFYVIVIIAHNEKNIELFISTEKMESPNKRWTSHKSVDLKNVLNGIEEGIRECKDKLSLDSKTSSRRPMGRFVRTERKASVLSRKAFARIRRMRAER